VNLSELIAKRQVELGALEGVGGKPLTFRDLERRATEHGHKISFSTLAAYARGDRAALPPPSIREAIAAALGVPVDVIMRSAVESAAPQVLDDNGRVADHAMAWLVLTEGRTEQEIAHLLGVARQVLRGLDEVRGRDDQ
jgi:transcriptional regulator with XRE-family HTH domain